MVIEKEQTQDTQQTDGTPEPDATQVPADADTDKTAIRRQLSVQAGEFKSEIDKLRSQLSEYTDADNARKEAELKAAGEYEKLELGYKSKESELQNEITKLRRSEKERAVEMALSDAGVADVYKRKGMLTEYDGSTDPSEFVKQLQEKNPTAFEQDLAMPRSAGSHGRVSTSATSDLKTLLDDYNSTDNKKVLVATNKILGLNNRGELPESVAKELGFIE